MKWLRHENVSTFIHLEIAIASVYFGKIIKFWDGLNENVIETYRLPICIQSSMNLWYSWRFILSMKCTFLLEKKKLKYVGM